MASSTSRVICEYRLRQHFVYTQDYVLYVGDLPYPSPLLTHDNVGPPPLEKKSRVSAFTCS